MDEREHLRRPGKATQRKGNTFSTGHLLPSTRGFETYFVKPNYVFPSPDQAFPHPPSPRMPVQFMRTVLPFDESIRENQAVPQHPACGSLRSAHCSHSRHAGICSVFSVFLHIPTPTALVLGRLTSVERSVSIVFKCPAHIIAIFFADLGGNCSGSKGDRSS